MSKTPRTTSQSASHKSMAGKVNHAVGSGSRPGGSRIPLQSTAPRSAQKLRG